MSSTLGPPDRDDMIELAGVAVAKNDQNGRWHVVLFYPDAKTFLSRVSFATEDEATKAAYKWALANSGPAPGTRPN